MPFLLQAVPTASLVLPPLGTARRNWQLNTRSARESYLLLAGADILDVGENDVNSLALRTLDVHEEGVRGLYESLEFVSVLLLGRVNVKKVDLHFFQIKC